MTNSINTLSAKAEKAGFELYLSNYNRAESITHDIYTATKGKYSGEVIDLYYDNSGEVFQIDYTTQYKGQAAKFRF